MRLLLALVLALFPSLAESAIALDTSTGFGGNTVGGVGDKTVTFTGFTAATGSTVVVGVLARRGDILPTILSVTYNGVSLIQARTGTFSFGNGKNYYSDPAVPIGDGSPHDIVVTVDTTNCDVTLGISSWIGVATVNDSLTGGNAAGTSTAPASTVSTSAAGEIIVDSVVANDPGTATPDATQTQLYNTTINGTIRGAGSWKAGAASVALSWTLANSTTWLLQSLALQPSGVSSGRERTKTGVGL